MVRTLCRCVGGMRGSALSILALAGAGTADATYAVPFGSQTLIGSTVAELAVFAANLDGSAGDELILVRNGETVQWWRHTGTGTSGTWQAYAIAGTSGVDEAVPGDIDGNGHLDLLVRNGDVLAWLINDGSSTPALPSGGIAVEPGAEAIAAGDLDGDGDTDVAVATTAAIIWYENVNGDGSAWSRHVADSLGEMLLLWAVDANGDGHSDLLACNATAAHALLSDGASDPVFTREPIPLGGLTLSDIAVTDWEGDGDADLAVASRSQLGWVQRESSGWKYRVIGSMTDSRKTIRWADLDGDGLQDIVRLDHQTSGFPNAGLIWYESQPGDPPSFLSHTVLVPEPGLNLAAMGDFDGDGDVDIGEVCVRITYAYIPPFPPLYPGRYIPVYNYETRWRRNAQGPALLSPSLIDLSGDGVNTPGEPGSLHVTLVNRSGVTGGPVTLEARSLTATVVLTLGSREFDVLSPAESIGVDFPYTTDPSAVCGSLISAEVTLTAAAGTALTRPPVERFGVLRSFPASGEQSGPLPIPDNDVNGLESVITLEAPAGATLTAFSVSVNITHPFTGDLLVSIRAPGGEEATLFNGQGQAGQDLVATYPVTAFHGLAAAGDYTLEIIDQGATDEGSLDSWSIAATYQAWVCDPWHFQAMVLELLGVHTGASGLDVNGDGQVDAADIVDYLLEHGG